MQVTSVPHHRDGCAMRETTPEWQMNNVAERLRAVSSARRLTGVTASAGPVAAAPEIDEAIPDYSPLDESMRAASGSRSPFDDVFAAMTGTTSRELRVEAPASRFMVRVAKVSQPHRPTKRNYNYFEDLNAALAARARQRAASDERI